jgi:fatty acid-binding protein DegV
MPEYIALIHSRNQAAFRLRPLCQHIQDSFPNTPFSEHSLNPHLAALFGPESTALVIVEKQG